MATSIINRTHRRNPNEKLIINQSIESRSYQALMHRFVDLMERIGKSDKATTIENSVSNRVVTWAELKRVVDSLKRIFNDHELARAAGISTAHFRKILNVSKLPSHMSDEVMFDKLPGGQIHPTLPLTKASYLSNAVDYISSYNELEELYEQHSNYNTLDYGVLIANFIRNKKISSS